MQEMCIEVEDYGDRNDGKKEFDSDAAKDEKNASIIELLEMKKGQRYY